jgi:hypothetical protein
MIDPSHQAISTLIFIFSKQISRRFLKNFNEALQKLSNGALMLIPKSSIDLLRNCRFA